MLNTAGPKPRPSQPQRKTQDSVRTLLSRPIVPSDEVQKFLAESTSTGDDADSEGAPIDFVRPGQFVELRRSVNLQCLHSDPQFTLRR